MNRMKGIIVPIVTPFNKNDEVDYKATKVLVEYLINEKVDSLYPCGSTGEMLKMSVQERKTFAEAVVEYADGRIPVYVHVGAPTTKQTLELAQHAYSIGSTGIGVVTPQYFKVNPREIEEFYVTISCSLPDDFPIYMYNIPQCSGNDITPELIENILKRTKNIIGIKYSYPDFVRFKEYLLCGDGNFDVVCGPDQLFLPALAMGCKGTVSGCSQCYPKPFVEIYQKFLEGDLVGAREAQNIANQLVQIVKAGENIAYFKSAIEYNKIASSYMRAPALDLTEIEKENLFTFLDAFHNKFGYE